MRAEIEAMVGGDTLHAGLAQEASLTGTARSNAAGRAERPGRRPQALEQSGNRAGDHARAQPRCAASIDGERDARARARRRLDADRAGRGRGRRRPRSTRRSAAAAGAQEQAGKRQLETLLSGEADANDAIWRSMPAPAAPRPGLGRDAAAHVHALGRAARLQGRSGWKKAPARRPASSRRPSRSSGENAYGWLKTETGVHRLVRISPYDSKARRHTSFASVWVYPVIDDTIEIEMLDKDLKGRYLPRLGCRRPARQQDRLRRPHHPSADRHRRRLPGRPLAAPQPRQAMEMLKARLYERELQKPRGEAGQDRGRAKTDIGWGHQIRSYVLQPYQMVKDLRTGVETSDTGGVLDGDLDEFLAASLARGWAIRWRTPKPDRSGPGDRNRLRGKPAALSIAMTGEAIGLGAHGGKRKGRGFDLPMNAQPARRCGNAQRIIGRHLAEPPRGQGIPGFGGIGFQICRDLVAARGRQARILAEVMRQICHDGGP